MKYEYHNQNMEYDEVSVENDGLNTSTKSLDEQYDDLIKEIEQYNIYIENIWNIIEGHKNNDQSSILQKTEFAKFEKFMRKSPAYKHLSEKYQRIKSALRYSYD